MYAFGNRSAVTNELYSIMADRGRQLRNLLKEMSQIDHQIVDLGGQSQRLKYEEIARGRKKQKMEGQERSNSNEQSDRMSYSTKKIKQIQLREKKKKSKDFLKRRTRSCSSSGSTLSSRETLRSLCQILKAENAHFPSLKLTFPAPSLPQDSSSLMASTTGS